MGEENLSISEIKSQLIDKQEEISNCINTIEALLKQLPKELGSLKHSAQMYYIPYLKGALGLPEYERTIMVNLQNTIDELNYYELDELSKDE